MAIYKPAIDFITKRIVAEQARLEQAKRNIIFNPVDDDIDAPIDFTTSTIEKPAVREVKKGPFSFNDIVPRVETVPEQISSPKPVQRVEVATTPEEKEQMAADVEADTPWWMRVMQAFAAPFEWVDKYIIEPGEGWIGTDAVPFLTGGRFGIEKVERKPGEDYWDWTRRSFEAWDTPTLLKIPVPFAPDGTWDIDVKGILQFAPWLLIPGPAGLASKVGKLGTVGKVVAPLIEYSPWGLVEKGTRVALSKTVGPIAKAIGKQTEAASARLYGRIRPADRTPGIEKFDTFVRDELVPLRKQVEEALPGLRARQTAANARALERLQAGELTPVNFRRARRGGLRGGVKQNYQTTTEFTDDEVLDIIRPVFGAIDDVNVKGDFLDAMFNLLLNHDIPEPRHLKSIANIYGGDIARSLNTMKDVAPSTFDKIWDALNLPRAVLASLDISAVGRQGLVLGLSHPRSVPRSFYNQMRSLFSEKWALDVDARLRADPIFPEFIQHSGYFAPLKKSAALAMREESFMSKLAEKIPFVRPSERGFINYLNSLRLNAYKSARASYIAQGAGPNELRSLARFVNLASGRGTLPANLNQYAPVLNTLLFSSRLQMSRLQLPRQLGRMLLSKNGYERKEAARALTTFLGGGIGLVTLLNTTGVAKIEGDPRSVDFGKIRFREGFDAKGNPKYSETRFDIWTGYLQYARFVTQLLTGQRKTAYGNVNKAERSDIAFRFLQSKSSPAFGLLVDLLKGENYMGEPIFNDTIGFMKTAKERLAPLALQDIIDATEQNGLLNGLFTALPTEMGIGTLTYIDDFVRTKEKIARSMGYESWDEIDPKTQLEAQNNNLELQAAQLEYDRRIMGSAWGDWRLAGNAIEDVFAEDINKAVAQYRATGDGPQFREKVSDAFMKRRGGYDAREQDERFTEIVRRQQTKDPVQQRLLMGPEQEAIFAYSQALYADDMYDEFGDYRFDEADIRKEAIRESLGDEMYQYIQDYLGEKYATLPAEFHELAEAKKILKPYWDARTRVEKLFGKAFAESLAGQRLIAKRRKVIRASNPRIEEAYQKYYARP